MKKRLISAICAFALVCSQFNIAFAADETVENENTVIVSEEISEQTEIIENEAIEDASETISEEIIDGNADDTDDVIEDNNDEFLNSQLFSDIEDVENKEDELFDLNIESFAADAPTPVVIESSSLSIEYSYNNKKFATLSDFDEDITEYSVTLPQNSKFAYVKISAPENSVKDVFTSWMVDYVDPVLGDVLIGANDYKKNSGDPCKLASNSFRQTRVPMDALQENDSFVVPIKNENGTIQFKYNNTIYKIEFTAKQPRLTEFNGNTHNSNGGVVFVGGAGAYNDNGTMTETSATGSSGVKQVRGIGNISKKLVGASVFMLPDINNANDKASTKLFSFKADHAGSVYVLTDTKITNQKATGYVESNGWYLVENNINAEGIQTGKPDKGSSSTLLTPRNYNDYTNTDYFAWSIAWYCESSSERTVQNLKRAHDPGVYGDTNAHTSTTSYSTYGAWAMTYAYKKSFEIGEEVVIPGFCNSTSTSTDKPSQDTSIMVVWDDAEIIEPSDKFVLKCSSDDKIYNDVTEQIVDNKFEFALPDNSLYGYLDLGLPFGAKAEVFAGKTSAVKSENGYMIPIKNGKGTALVTYTNNSVVTEYEVTFTAKQPKLEIINSNITDGDVIAITGVAVLNDNGSILDCADLEAKKPKALSGISNDLIGSAMFMLPISAMAKDDSFVRKHGDEDMFSFKSDIDGTVYVLFDSIAPMHSEYELLWDVENSLTATYNETILNKVYSYPFAADEVVGVPAPEGLADNWNGSMAVFVKFN